MTEFKLLSGLERKTQVDDFRLFLVVIPSGNSYYYQFLIELWFGSCGWKGDKSMGQVKT